MTYISYPRARARIRFLVAFFARGVPGIFASFLFYLVKNTRAVAVAVAAAGKKSVVFEEFAYFYALPSNSKTPFTNPRFTRVQTSVQLRDFRVHDKKSNLWYKMGLVSVVAHIFFP